MSKPKSFETQTFRSIITRYYLKPDDAASDLGISPATIHDYYYGQRQPPQAVLIRLLNLLPELTEQSCKNVQKKIEKLEYFKTVLKDFGKSAETQLNAMIKQNKKGRKIPKELEEFDLKYTKPGPNSEPSL